MRLLEHLPREAGRDYALRTLKANIISLDLAPGAQISENALATQMGLSRTPVREALLELSRENIIEIQPQKRSVVAKIDCGLVDESRFMRRLLECAVVELACERAESGDIRRLEENVGLQKFYLESFYPESLLVLDNQFHEILFSIAGKSHVYTLMERMAIHFDRIRALALSSVKNARIIQDHEDIITAILRGDKADARALMEAHLDRYEINVGALREKYPDYFV